MFYGPPVGALLPVGGHKGYGLSVFCEILSGALTGGQTTHPGESHGGQARQQHALARVRSLTPFAVTKFFGNEIERFVDWVKASPPVEANGEILLPGELERRTRAQRERDGIPLEAATRRMIADAARSLGVAAPAGFVA